MLTRASTGTLALRIVLFFFIPHRRLAAPLILTPPSIERNGERALQIDRIPLNEILNQVINERHTILLKSRDGTAQSPDLQPKNQHRGDELPGMRTSAARLSTSDLESRHTTDPIFQPLTINGLTLKNRVVRSSLGGRIDYYDGSMSDARIAWDRRFARGGVSAIISSNAGIRTDGIRRAGLREHRRRPHDSLVARARQRKSTNTIAATSFSSTFPAGSATFPRKEFVDVPPMSATDKPDRLYGLRARAHDHRRDSRSGAGLRACGAARARGRRRRHRDRRVQRLSPASVPVERDQRPHG